MAAAPESEAASKPPGGADSRNPLHQRRPRKVGKRKPVVASNPGQRRKLTETRAQSSDLRRRLRWAIDNELARQGLTIADLARLAGRDRATVSHSLRSARVASLDVLVFYAEALGLRVTVTATARE